MEARSNTMETMKVDRTLMQDAVRIEATLRWAGEWLCAEQLQLGLSSKRQYKAMRLLIVHGLVEARLYGEGANRYKIYHAPRVTPMKPAGYPRIKCVEPMAPQVTPQRPIGYGKIEAAYAAHN